MSPALVCLLLLGLAHGTAFQNVSLWWCTPRMPLHFGCGNCWCGKQWGLPMTVLPSPSVSTLRGSRRSCPEGNEASLLELLSYFLLAFSQRGIPGSLRCDVLSCCILWWNGNNMWLLHTQFLCVLLGLRGRGWVGGQVWLLFFLSL